MVAVGGGSSPPEVWQMGRVGSAGGRLGREAWGFLEGGESSRVAVVVLVAAGKLQLGYVGGIVAGAGAGAGGVGLWLGGGRIVGLCVRLLGGIVGAEAAAGGGAAAVAVAVRTADSVVRIGDAADAVALHALQNLQTHPFLFLYHPFLHPLTHPLTRLRLSPPLPL